MARIAQEVRWTTSIELLAKVQRAWERGGLLKSGAGALVFPWEIVLKGPKPRELSEHYAEVQAWIAELNRHARPAQVDGYDLTWGALGGRTSGVNQIPVSAVLQTPEHAIALLGLQAEQARWHQLVAVTRTSCPSLLSWVIAHPLQVLAHAVEWERLIRVVTWIGDHPRPGIYLRQLDLPGIDTKFIERQESFLKQMLDAVLDDSARNGDEPDFARRFGFTAKPMQVRMRVLDPLCSIGGLTQLTAPVEQWATINPGVRRVVITENEINGLSFPALAESLIVFGLGYGVERLAEIPWLGRCEVWYWGDIDTDGFTMLDRVRGFLPHTRSFLMDEATVLRHRDSWGEDPAPTHRQPSRLTAAESSLWVRLR